MINISWDDILTYTYILFYQTEFSIVADISLLCFGWTPSMERFFIRIIVLRAEFTNFNHL